MRMRKWSNLVGSAACLCLLASSAAQADLIVTPTVTPLGGVFRYDYTIVNDLLEDVVLVDIIVLRMDETLTNLFAPLGFQAIYDSGLGIVTFLPAPGSVDLFAVGTSLSGFGFDSAIPSAPSTFEALTLLGNFLTGPTEAPVGRPVPEPAPTLLLLVGVSSLIATGLARRHRRSM